MSKLCSIFFSSFGHGCHSGSNNSTGLHLPCGRSCFTAVAVTSIAILLERTLGLGPALLVLLPVVQHVRTRGKPPCSMARKLATGNTCCSISHCFSVFVAVLVLSSLAFLARPSARRAGECVVSRNLQTTGDSRYEGHRYKGIRSVRDFFFGAKGLAHRY
jgi:hypothetical protein